MNTPNHLPTVDEVEQFAPEVYALADRYADVTLAGDADFDLEIFDAIDSYLQGGRLSRRSLTFRPNTPACVRRQPCYPPDSSATL